MEKLCLINTLLRQAATPAYTQYFLFCNLECVSGFHAGKSSLKKTSHAQIIHHTSIDSTLCGVLLTHHFLFNTNKQDTFMVCILVETDCKVFSRSIFDHSPLTSPYSRWRQSDHQFSKLVVQSSSIIVWSKRCLRISPCWQKWYSNPRSNHNLRNCTIQFYTDALNSTE